MSADTCQETAGFLFKHACGNKPLGQCDTCSKWVCKRHTRVVEGANLCIGCAKAQLRPGKQTGGGRGAGRGGGRGGGRGRRSYDDDPYFYGYSHYQGYDSYRQGSWGHDYYLQTRDADEFTEADGASFATEGDEGWEQEMGAS